MFRAGQFGSFAEAGDAADGAVLVNDVSNGGAAREAGGRIRFTAFHGHVKLAQFAFAALPLGGPLHELLGLERSLGGGADVALAFDGETRDRLSGFGDAIDDALRPTRLNANDNGGGNVGIASGTDHRTEKKVEVLAELEPAICMRQGEG